MALLRLLLTSLYYSCEADLESCREDGNVIGIYNASEFLNFYFTVPYSSSILTKAIVVLVSSAVSIARERLLSKRASTWPSIPVYAHFSRLLKPINFLLSISLTNFETTSRSVLVSMLYTLSENP